MGRVDVEVCIHSTGPEAVRDAVAAAYEGGAARVELCARMDLDGLTPPAAHVEAARAAFRDRPGLLAMIRPSASFTFAPADLIRMQASIRDAAAAGADGVVLGALRPDGRLDADALSALLDTARAAGLRTTFHRAFDAVPDADEALETLAGLGVDRVLTAGVPWGRPGTALDGAERLARTIRRAAGRVEVVAGGGVSLANVRALLERLPAGRVSVHAYSGAQSGGRTTVAAVRALVAAAGAAVAPPGGR